jgi:hypothetical protein
MGILEAVFRRNGSEWPSAAGPLFGRVQKVSSVQHVNSYNEVISSLPLSREVYGVANGVACQTIGKLFITKHIPIIRDS